MLISVWLESQLRAAKGIWQIRAANFHEKKNFAVAGNWTHDLSVIITITFTTTQARTNS